MVEHGQKALFRDIACARTIDVIADCLVICGNCLGDRTRRPADSQEPACYFLAGADLRERAINGRIKVQGQCLAVSIVLQRIS